MKAMVNSIRVDKDVPMKMRDGVALRANIFRPDDSEKHPAVLIRSPYNKWLSTPSRRYFSAVDAAFDGFVVIVQDTRGRFSSEGGAATPQLEEIDGYDSVEWVAAEPWCDGNVGMVGVSYLAGTQWQAAMQRPPHLKAIAPGLVGSGRVEEVIFSAGAMHWDLVATFPLAMVVEVVNRLEQQGQDVSEMRRMVEHARSNVDEIYNYLPMKDIPLFRTAGLSQTLGAMLSTRNLEPEVYLNSFWRYEEIDVPCLHFGGWYDWCVGGMFKNFLAMRERAASQFARDSQHIMCGPWHHDTALTAYVGEIHFGPEASSANALVHEAHTAFFNRYLRGMDAEVPVISYFVMGKNIWQQADAWPLPGTRWERFFLHSSGHANTAAGDGLLTKDEPGTEAPDTFIYNPHDPVPTTGGRNTVVGRLVSGPIDQSFIERRHDILCYTTPPLDQDIEVTGPLVLHLFASTSVVDTDFTAKLIDVHPNGKAYVIADGIIRARYRKSVLEPEVIDPGKTCEYLIDMAATSNLFRRGHRIRVNISSSNFPRYDRNMNTGNQPGEDAKGIPAMQTIHHHKGHASYVDLPVIPQ